MAVSIIKRKYRLAEGRPIEALNDAIEVTSGLKLTRGEFAVYRGQPSSHYLRPAAFRRARWFRHERDMVRDLVSTHPQEFTGDPLMLDRLVRMQHYGLPTRLLDVTQNFLASLFFATGNDPDKPKDDGHLYVIRGGGHLRKYYDSDTISLVSNLANLSEDEKWDIFEKSPDNENEVEGDAFNTFPAMDRLLQFVRDEKPYFRDKVIKKDLFQTFLVIPKKNNRRIVAQSGAFLVFGLVGRDRNPGLPGFTIKRHRIPNANKASIRAALEALGITQSNLFPEIDKAALQIAEAYRHA